MNLCSLQYFSSYLSLSYFMLILCSAMAAKGCISVGVHLDYTRFQDITFISTELLVGTVGFKKLKWYFVSTEVLPIKQLLNIISRIYTGKNVNRISRWKNILKFNTCSLAKCIIIMALCSIIVFHSCMLSRT